jgi:hypothetical protein
VSRVIAPPRHGPLDAAQVQALFAEARRRQRDRRRRAVRLILAAALLAAAVVAGGSGLIGRGVRTPAEGPGWLPAGPAGPMPAQVVALTTGGNKIQVLSSRTGRVVRTLASNVGLFQGIPTIAVSPAGVVYFDTARDDGEQWIESTPLTGGPITPIGPGDMPAISPDGRLLAYLAWTVQIYPPNTPARDMKPPAPEAIVVRNLQTGAIRRWAFTSLVPAISSLSWSPDNRFLAYTSLSWASGQPPPDVTQLLDTRAGSTLTSARRIPLAPGLEWADFLTPQAGLAVTPYPPAEGRQQTLVAVATRTGRILGRLIGLPRQGLATANAFDGTEGAITADPTGRYLLIATNGPRGNGEILRWAIGERHLTGLAAGAGRAAWT